MPINEQKINLNLQNNLEHKPINASDLPGVNRIGPPENIMLPTYSIYHFNNPHTTAEWYQNDDQFVKYHIMGHAPIDAQGPGAESLNEATKNYQHFGKKFMRRGLSDRQIARLDNKHDIDQSIFDLAQEDLEIQYNYDKQRYENGEISEQKWRQLKNRYNRWSKNLGNNQLSLDQKQNPLDYIQVHKPGDIAPALFSIGLPLAVTAAIYGAPYIPWIMKNVAIPTIGGEIINDVTRKVSDGYYSSFGDFVYRSTPLDDWTKDTWAETPTKFVADMTNPGYWAPYGKIVNGFKNIVPTITKTYNKPVKIDFSPREALRYRANPNVKSAAWKGGITKWYLSNIVLPNKIDSGIKYMTKNNPILKERLWKTYNRDLGISQYLEFFPPKQNGVVKDNTIMLIHGDPASTGVYTTAAGIGRGTSTIHHYPTMNNGKLYPTKDVYHDYFGPVQNKIFWGENKPHGWSLTKSFDTFIDDLKHIDHKILSSTDKKVLYSHPGMTTSEIPYRFIFGDAKKLNGIERNTPNLSLGTEWITNEVNLKDLNGLEWNPFLGVWEKHIYQSRDRIINSKLTDGIPIIWVDK